MTIRLRLLADVSFDGEPIPGGRSAGLLAALVLQPAGVTDGRLVEAVWSDAAPAAPAKTLQVQVSRIRAQCGPATVQRYDAGYRLGLDAGEVDAWLLEDLVGRARAAVGSDPHAALADANAAEALLSELADTDGDGPLAEVRARARGLARGVGRSQGLALSRTGRDAEAVGRLERIVAGDPDDTEALVALLRSEAVAVGAPAALARYDAYRRDLADRLGVDPDPTLQRVHRELLVADEPVRSGIHYDADELLGRAADLAELRAMVRTGRLTTILGPGGLGKTRVAHVLAREATQPRVHFVELVGISSSADVVAEVGSALGVRNSVTGRRTLTPAQLADVRGRISQELDAVPTLLVLDNCEHVLDGTASLVAFLLATTGDLRVVTTSRAPLGIAAERVFRLSQLAPEDGAELFGRRARAVRPDAELPHDVVDDIVARLDGLPLAVELAAARVRSMTAAEVRRALDDRFSLLRGHDRTAPARHQTLTAVIGWSWDLLAPEEQRALSWLSVFHDGLTADAARAVLGPAGPDLVEALVDQSLLAVTEQGGVTRYRMLETVREFGAHRLRGAGQVDEALDEQTRWALDLAAETRELIFGPRQIEAVDVLSREEGNLAEILRRLLSEGDAVRGVPLLAVVGALWAITGNHPRFFALADLAEQVLLDWEPPPELVQVTADALGLLLVHLGFLRPEGVTDLTATMSRLGEEPVEPWTRVLWAIFGPTIDPTERVAAALALTEHPDPATALMAWQWAGVLAENQGEVDAARTYVDKALGAIDDQTTPWQVATLHTQLAMLDFSAGLHHDAAAHARIAIPLLERLHADEDALSMRTSLALTALHDGDLDEAERVLAAAGEPTRGDVTGAMVMYQVRAELLLARGDVEGALRAFLTAVESMRAVQFPGVETNGQEPWTVLALGTALTAYARYGSTATDAEQARALAGTTYDVVHGLMCGPEAGVDYPVSGMALAALAVWLLTQRSSPASVESGVRLLALASAFAYTRWFPVMAWEALAALAEDAAPGRLAEVAGEYEARRGHELRDEVLRNLSAVPPGGVTSSA